MAIAMIQGIAGSQFRWCGIKTRRNEHLVGGRRPRLPRKLVPSGLGDDFGGRQTSSLPRKLVPSGLGDDKVGGVTRR